MQAHLRKLHQALVAHKAAHESHMAANDALHTALGEFTGFAKDTNSNSPSVTGHLGQIARAVTLHKSVHDVHVQGHQLFHDSLRKAVDGLAQHVGATIERTNPNVRAAGGNVSTTEDSTGQTPLPSKAGKAMTGKQMQEAMDRLQKSMPSFGSGRRTGRVNPNSLGNPLWQKP